MLVKYLELRGDYESLLCFDDRAPVNVPSMRQQSLREYIEYKWSPARAPMLTADGSPILAIDGEPVCHNLHANMHIHPDIYIRTNAHTSG